MGQIPIVGRRKSRKALLLIGNAGDFTSWPEYSLAQLVAVADDFARVVGFAGLSVDLILEGFASNEKLIIGG